MESHKPSQLSFLKNDSQRTTCEGVEEETVKSFFGYVHTIDSSLQKDALRSQDLKKC